MSSFRNVVSLSRGMEVLRAVNSDGRATVGSIHARTGFDKATIVRMLETLEEEGYLVRNPDGPSYAPAGKVKQLSSGYNRHVEMGRKGAEVMRQLHQQICWPTSLAIFDVDAMVLTEPFIPPRGIGVIRQPGYRFPMLTTSLGMAFLAEMPRRQSAEVIARLAQNPTGWNSRAANPLAVEAQLERIREQGFAMTDPEYIRSVYDDDLWGASVAVPGRDGLHGSVGVMVLARACSVESCVRDIIPILKAVSVSLGQALDD